MAQLDEHSLRATLVQANRSARAARPPLPAHTNVAMREYLAATGPELAQVRMYQIWFRTRGCTYDRAGQCSMCNYGVGPEIDARRVARSVGLLLEQVPEGGAIYLSPSGSLLDELEVSAQLRDELLGLVAARRPAMFAFETRPELITAAKLALLRLVLPDTAIIGQVGVESWDPQVRNLCHLKPTPQAAYLAASRLLAQHGLASIANITLGGLGLSDAEAYHDAVSSIGAARAAGFTTQMVFPLSAKTGSLLGWAAQQGMWRPPSLWLLVRVLMQATGDQADPHQRIPVSISWFDADLDKVVRQRPDGCPRCRDFLLGTLQAFRADPCAARLDPARRWQQCDCPSQVATTIDNAHAQPGYLRRLRAIADRWRQLHVDAAVSSSRPTRTGRPA